MVGRDVFECVCYAAVTRIQCTCLLLLAHSRSRSLSFTHIPSLRFAVTIFFSIRGVCSLRRFIYCLRVHTNTNIYLPLPSLLLMRCVCVRVQFVFFSITMCLSWPLFTDDTSEVCNVCVIHTLCAVLFVVPVVPLLASDNRSHLLIASANSSERTEKKRTIIIVLKTKSFEKQTYPKKTATRSVRNHWVFVLFKCKKCVAIKNPTKWKVFHRSAIKFNKRTHWF